ncbi:MAG: tetratricopeptide repeat protein [Phycisphaeraceae bacterium JB051]
MIERSASTPETTSPRHQWLMGGLLMLLTLVVYLPALQCAFIWDDDHYVTENRTLHDVEGLKRIWTEPGAVPQYYPLVHTLFWVQYQLFELDPLSYHLVNVICHALVSLLWWRVLRRMSIPGAYLAAMIFAVHPIQVESVAWVTELKNVLSGVFYLLAALLYLRFSGTHHKTIQPQLPTVQPSPRRWLWYGLSLLCFLGAMFSKTVACTLPAALVLVMWWQRRQFPWRDLLCLLPMFVIGIGLGLHTAMMEKHHVGAEGADWAFSLGDRFLIAGRALWFYAGKILWPEHLVFFYDYWNLDTSQWWQWLLPVGFVVAVYGCWRNRQLWGYGPVVALLFFAGTLFPALGFIDVFPMRFSFVADHFQYHAGMGIIALFAAGFYWLTKRHRKLQSVLAALILIALGGRNMAYQPVFENQRTLWQDVIAHNRAPWMALNNLGVLEKKAGNLEAARDLYQRAIVHRPFEWNSYSNLGIVYKEWEQYDRAATLLEQASKFMRAQSHVYSSLAHVRELQGDIPQAIALLEKAVKQNSVYADAWANLGILHLNQGNHDKAMIALKRAIQTDRYQESAYIGLSRALTERKRFDEALANLRNGLDNLPQSAQLHHHTAVALMKRGQLQEAISHWQKATRIAPDEPDYALNLGAALLKARQWQPARQALEQGLKLDPTRVSGLRNLAMCLLNDPSTNQAHWIEAKEAMERLFQNVDTPLLSDHRLLATACEASGDYAQAIKVLGNILADPTIISDVDEATRAQIKAQLARCQSQLQP